MIPQAPQKPSGKAKGQICKKATGVQSPPKASSPLKLKRSASFIGVSPAKGSLIVEQQKRAWAQKQKMELLANKAAGTKRDPSQNGEMLIQQHSEGDYPVVGFQKVTNLRGQWNLMDEELRSVAS